MGYGGECVCMRRTVGGDRVNKDQKKSKIHPPNEQKAAVGQRVPEGLPAGQRSRPRGCRKFFPTNPPAHQWKKNGKNTVILSFNNPQKGNSSRGGKSHCILPIAFLPGKRGADMIDFPVFSSKVPPSLLVH